MASVQACAAIRGLKAFLSCSRSYPRLMAIILTWLAFTRHSTTSSYLLLTALFIEKRSRSVRAFAIDRLPRMKFAVY